MQKQTPASWLLTSSIIIAAIGYQLAFVASLELPADFFILNSVIFIGCTILALVGSPYPSGPYQTVMSFYAIFFGIIPPLHLSQGVVVWEAGEEVLNFYAHASAVALVGLFCFQLSYMFLTKRTGSGTFVNSERKYTISSERIVFTSLLASLLIYLANDLSIASVFVRSGDVKTLIISDQTVFLIYSYFIYPIPCVSLIMYARLVRKVDYVYIILAILCLLSTPPTGAARFLTGTLYIGILLATFPSIMSIRYFLPLLLLFGMFLVFPFLNIFRAFGSEWSFSAEFLYVGHFDSFQSLASALLYGDPSGGTGLLGVLLFFVPRALWPDKPIGSGAALAEQQGFSFGNISMNFIAEGYLNFGISGAVIFMAIAGAIIGRLDRNFWRRASSLLFDVQYILLIGLVFFIARGDLLSSFAYTMGILASTLLVWKIAMIRR